MPQTVENSKIKPEDIHLPPNSFWPIVLALGFVLILVGAALHFSIAIVGLLLTFISAVGWVIEPIHTEDDH